MISSERDCASCGIGELEEGKRHMKCSRCGLVYYCCKNHQKLDWKNHKKSCIPKAGKSTKSDKKSQNNVEITGASTSETMPPASNSNNPEQQTNILQGEIEEEATGEGSESSEKSTPAVNVKASVQYLTEEQVKQSESNLDENKTIHVDVSNMSTDTDVLQGQAVERNGIPQQLYFYEI